MRIIEKAKRLFRRPAEHRPEDIMKKYDCFDDNGKFIPCDTPMAPPIGYSKQPSMVEIVRDMVKSEKLKQEAAEADFESFEESEDFEVGDDEGMPPSPWENEFDPPIDQLMEAGREAMAAKAKDNDPPPAAPEPAKKKKAPAKTPPPEADPQEAGQATPTPGISGE